MPSLLAASPEGIAAARKASSAKSVGVPSMGRDVRRDAATQTHSIPRLASAR
jgi:hypothetical protein